MQAAGNANHSGTTTDGLVDVDTLSIVGVGSATSNARCDAEAPLRIRGWLRDDDEPWAYIYDTL